MADKKLGEIKQWKNKEMKKNENDPVHILHLPFTIPFLKHTSDHNTQHPELQIFITHIAKTLHIFIFCHFPTTL